MSGLHQTLIDIGAGAAAISAVLVLLSLLGGRRVVRWIARQITASIRDGVIGVIDERVEPIIQRLETRIGRVEAEVRPNGGKSMRDDVRAIRDHLGIAPPYQETSK